MNRKQVLKNQKKKKREKNIIEEENYFSRFISTLLLIIVLLVVGYLVIGIFFTKTIKFGKDKEEEETKEVTIDNSTILASQIFDQKEDEYYVLIYNVSEDKMTLKDWSSLYSEKEDSKKIYVVDSSKKINNKYLTTEEGNRSPSSYDDLKIKSPSLIKINNKKVESYFEGEKEIIEEFNK